MTMARIFTKRIACRACREFFTITSAASRFCKRPECVRGRRRADRLARKAAAAAAVQVGSAEHLARALRSGE